MHDLNDFKAVVGDLITLLEEFNEIETAKLDAIQKNRVTFVEENMKKEQAGIMIKTPVRPAGPGYAAVHCHKGQCAKSPGGQPSSYQYDAQEKSSRREQRIYQ